WNGHLVVMKNYPPQFKADAVNLGAVGGAGVQEGWVAVYELAPGTGKRGIGVGLLQPLLDLRGRRRAGISRRAQGDRGTAPSSGREKRASCGPPLASSPSRMLCTSSSAACSTLWASWPRAGRSSG
ncbi:hypothetical protein, partial [Streptomyces longwoodensis]|uniref:hypothetical protein n=1 Tax=Streptomyces longwoodensis TaxID=68231 RepID=UPI003406A840